MNQLSLSGVSACVREEVLGELHMLQQQRCSSRKISVRKISAGDVANSEVEEDDDFAGGASHGASSAGRGVRGGAVWQHLFLDIVEHPSFDNTMLCAVLLNACCIAAEIDYYSRDPARDDDDAGAWTVVDGIFLFVFAVELVLRVGAYRCAFFRATFANGAPNRMVIWNWLDVFLVGFQMFFFVTAHLSETVRSVGSLTSLLRLLRLVRLVRILKVFRWVHHLRVIVLSIFRSFPIFLWSFVAMFLMTFMFACWFAEVVRINRKKNPDGEYDEELSQAFGSMPRTVLSLMEATTGGIDWGDLSALLARDNGLMLFGRFPLVLYVYFTLLAMMNVITGVFLETAIGKAKDEKEVLLASHAARIFQKADVDNSGMISWEDFAASIRNNRSVQDFFDALDIDHTQAKSLFHLIDNSGDGMISATEFLQGCLNLSGPAKSLDLVILTKNVRQLFERPMQVEQGGGGDVSDNERK